MIFQGPGCYALIEDQLSRETILENWQLKQGSFSELTMNNHHVKKMDCERAVLDGSTFLASQLEECDFRQSSLQRVKFVESTISNCQWGSCQLRESRWDNLYLKQCLLRGCAAPKIRMENVKMKGVTLSEPEISRGSFSHISSVNSVFSAVHESGVTGIRKSEICDSLFISCRFTGRILAFSTLRNCLFLGCSFTQMDWDLTDTTNTAFFDCTGALVSQGLGELGSLLKRDWNSYEQEVLCG